MTDEQKALVEQLYAQADRRHGSVGSLRSLEWKAADMIDAQAAENARVREAIKTQASAVRMLQANEQTEINILRKQRNEWHHAVSSLDSEREANALLTAENETLRKALYRLGKAGQAVTETFTTYEELRDLDGTEMLWLMTDYGSVGKNLGQELMAALMQANEAYGEVG